MDRLPFPGGQTSGSGVGHFRVSIHVGRRGEGGECFVPVEALVDTIEEIRAAEVDETSRAEPVGVAARDLQRGARHVGRDD